MSAVLPPPGEARETLRAAVEALANEIAADMSMYLAPGWMVRDACASKIRALASPAPTDQEAGR